MQRLPFTTLLLCLILIACGIPTTDSPDSSAGDSVSVVTPVEQVSTATISVASTPMSETRPSAITATVAVSPTSSLPPTVAAVLPTAIPLSLTPIPTAMPLPEGWTTVEWQGFIIPVPPEGEWSESSPEELQLIKVDAPVIAAGGIGYPGVTSPVERPVGPGFVIVQFTGSLDDWLAQEQRKTIPENPIVLVQDTIIAGRPAKLYQYSVTGTGFIGYYILKLTPDQLLWIRSEAIDSPYDRQVISGITMTDARLSHGWTTVEWQGLRIPVPLHAVWESGELGATENGYGQPVLATGVISYPVPAEGLPHVEWPSGPGFWIIAFDGSLEELLTLAEQQYPDRDTILDESIRDLDVSGHAAKEFQYTVGGLSGLAGGFMIVLDSDRVLVVNSESIERDRPIIEGIEFGP